MPRPTEDLKDREFGRLKVIKRAPNKNSRVCWECKCICGNIKTYFAYKLIQKTTKSCGCLSKGQYSKNNKRWYGYEDIPGRFWKNINSGRGHNRSKVLDMDIDIVYAWNLFIQQNRKCALTGIDLYFASGKKIPKGNASLDRINSNLGYIKGNIQWVHKTVNIMKNKLDQNDFIQWCRLISKHTEGVK